MSRFRRDAQIVLIALASAFTMSCEPLTKCIGDSYSPALTAGFSGGALTRTAYVGDTVTVFASYRRAYNGRCAPEPFESTANPGLFRVQSNVQTVAIDGMAVVGTSPGTATLLITYIHSSGGTSLVLTVQPRP